MPEHTTNPTTTDGAVWIVTGMPGAGKSTVSHAMATALPRAVRIRADDLNALIVSGAVWPLGQPAAEAARQVQLCHRNIGALAHNCTASGFTTVIDCVLPDRARLDGLLRLLPDQCARLVVLAPGEAACRERNAGRDADERFDFDGYRELDATMRAGFGDRGRWIDSADLSSAQTVRRIFDEPVLVRFDDGTRQQTARSNRS